MILYGTYFQNWVVNVKTIQSGFLNSTGPTTFTITAQSYDLEVDFNITLNVVSNTNWTIPPTRNSSFSVSLGNPTAM